MPEQELIQLPNKDLWRGYRPETSREDTLSGAKPSKIDSAMAAVLQAAAGKGELTCLWCGQQGDEKFIREHLKENHPSVLGITKSDESALLNAALQQAKGELAELKAAD